MQKKRTWCLINYASGKFINPWIDILNDTQKFPILIELSSNFFYQSLKLNY